MKRELKCGHCAKDSHERLPVELHPFCDKSHIRPNMMTNKQLRRRTEIAAALHDDVIKGRLKIYYCPDGVKGDDPTTAGHLYEVQTMTADHDWLWTQCFDDRKGLREGIAGWCRSVASWFIGLADDVEELASSKNDEVAIYDVVADDGEVLDRSFDIGMAKLVHAKMTERELTCRIIERTVKLPAGIEVTP